MSSLLSDTCSAYKLYFFSRHSVISSSDINIPSIGDVEFHQIVLDEFRRHRELLKQYKAGNFPSLRTSKQIPEFMFKFFERDLDSLEDFINNNIKNPQDLKYDDPSFAMKTKIFDHKRKEIQEDWKKQGKNQNKQMATSEPSDEDYILLEHAINDDKNIITNDGILNEVSKHFLSTKGKTAYRAEDIIQIIYDDDNSKKSNIQSAIKEMNEKEEYFTLKI